MTWTGLPADRHNAVVRKSSSRPRRRQPRENERTPTPTFTPGLGRTVKESLADWEVSKILEAAREIGWFTKSQARSLNKRHGDSEWRRPEAFHLVRRACATTIDLACPLADGLAAIAMFGTEPCAESAVMPPATPFRGRDCSLYTPQGQNRTNPSEKVFLDWFEEHRERDTEYWQKTFDSTISHEEVEFITFGAMWEAACRWRYRWRQELPQLRRS